MTKRKMNLSAFGEKTNKVYVYDAEWVWPLGDKIVCPDCRSVNMSAPMFDIVQYGLERDDHVITIMECRSCEVWYGMEYNTGDIE
jgi:hypothetical protein